MYKCRHLEVYKCLVCCFVFFCRDLKSFSWRKLNKKQMSSITVSNTKLTASNHTYNYWMLLCLSIIHFSKLTPNSLKTELKFRGRIEIEYLHLMNWRVQLIFLVTSVFNCFKTLVELLAKECSPVMWWPRGKDGPWSVWDNDFHWHCL